MSKRKAKVKPRELRLSATLNVLAAASDVDGLPVFEMVANTGQPMELEGWPYPVVIDLAGAEFAKAPTPVLEAHDRTKRLAHTTDHKITRGARGRITARGLVSGTGEAATTFVGDSRNGFPFESSLGARTPDWEFVDEGETVHVNGRAWKGPVIVARKTIIRELTVDVLGADGDTETRIAAAARRRGISPGALKMAKQRNTDVDLDDDDDGQDGEDILASERRRVDQINVLFARYSDIQVVNPDPDNESATKRIKASTFKRNAIRRGLTPMEVERVLLLASFPGEGNDGPAIHVSPTPESFGQRGKDILAAALLCRGGHERAAEKGFGEQVMEAAAPYRHYSFVDLARVGLQMEGKPVPTATADVIKASFSESTNAMTEALTGGIDKLVGVMFMESPQTWRSFAAKRDVPNFREHKIISAQHQGQLEQVAPSGDLAHGWIKDGSISLKCDTFGKVFGFNRQAAKNDDLSIFQDIPRVFVKAALRRQNDLVYEVILTNTDSHFSLAHGNLIDDVLTLPALSAAVTAMYKQRDDEGNDLDIIPRVLLVPPELADDARQILKSVEVARSATSDNAPTGNPLEAIADLEVESRLSNDTKFATASPTGWYLFASRDEAPVYVGFVDGREAPFVEFFGLDADPQRLGYTWRVYLDFAAGLGEYRSGVHSTGDGSSS